MAERSLHHHPFELSHTRTRQPSTSSSDQSSPTEDKSNPRHHRPSLPLGVHHPSTTLAREPSRRRGSKQVAPEPRERPSKGSSTSMTAPLDSPAEVTYTPTTHRISKAKKGKKVHACEHPGCNKIFTRAEHRKRHEANHNVKPAFECQFEDCRKPFNRADLLARHMERQHEVPTGAARAPGSLRSMSETSSNPPSGSIVPPTIGQPQPGSAQTMSHGPGAMAITSIIEHPMHNELGHSTRGIHDLGITPIPMGYRHEWVCVPLGAEDSAMYSSDSCSSPMSDYPNAQMSYHALQSHEGIQRPPSNLSDSSYHQQTITSPLSAGSAFPHIWGTPDPAPTYDGAYVPTVGIRNLDRLPVDLKAKSILGPSMQLPFTNVGSQQSLPVRDQSTSPAGMAMGRGGLLKIQDPRTRHYLECYWQYFHPLFPIVQIQSFMSTVPQPLLAASMVVVGAQYSPRPDAKQYSASLHEKCLKMLSDHGPITSRSPISDLQTILHMEMFTRYRARSAKIEHIQASPQFHSLYASLIADRHWLQASHAGLQQALSATNAPAQLQTCHRRWLDHETRRRVLAAAFVLDTQHSHLLQQKPSDVSTLGGEDDLSLPFPCLSETWNCTDHSLWRAMIVSQQTFSLATLDRSLPPLDPFQSSLRTCYQIHSLQRLKSPAENDLTFHPTKSGSLATVLVYHALCLCRHTPLHALIITASESWLFGTKITDEEVWQQARLKLRSWITSDAAMKAVWHATRLLRLSLQNQSQQSQPLDGVSYLHDLWCLYVAALVCWAFGYGTAGMIDVQPQWEREHAEDLAWEYLGAMDVQGWWEVSGVPSAARRSTKGPLECVRVKIGDVGLGGLLDGAEDVLFRLVDGESDMVKF
ncbi:MAG: hypothetical protein Q9211_004920 [Gyalolechia sp. 1 TL-2023]